jgi:hypothetical protein
MERKKARKRTHPNDVPMPPPEQTILTRLEACRAFRLSLSTFDRAVQEERIHVKRYGPRIIVRREEMDRFIEQL